MKGGAPVPTESIVVPLADRQRLLDGLPFLPRPEVSTWGLANLEISVPDRVVPR